MSIAIYSQKHNSWISKNFLDNFFLTLASLIDDTWWDGRDTEQYWLHDAPFLADDLWFHLWTIKWLPVVQWPLPISLHSKFSFNGLSSLRIISSLWSFRAHMGIRDLCTKSAHSVPGELCYCDRSGVVGSKVAGCQKGRESARNEESRIPMMSLVHVRIQRKLFEYFRKDDLRMTGMSIKRRKKKRRRIKNSFTFLFLYWSEFDLDQLKICIHWYSALRTLAITPLPAISVQSSIRLPLTVMASTVEKSYETSNKLIGYMSKVFDLWSLYF